MLMVWQIIAFGVVGSLIAAGARWLLSPPVREDIT